MGVDQLRTVYVRLRFKTFKCTVLGSIVRASIRNLRVNKRKTR